MSLLDRLKGDMRGVHYAVSLFVATTVLWIVVKEIGDANPIWAISSMVATSDPQVKQALQTFRGRIINTLLGCAIGLLFVAVGRTEWQLPFAMAVTVLLSSYVIRIPAMWRQAPITAAIVIAGGLEHHDKLTGMEQGLHRVIEVLLGCVVGIAVAWLLSRIWPFPRVRRREGFEQARRELIDRVPWDAMAASPTQPAPVAHTDAPTAPPTGTMAAFRKSR